MKGRMMDNDQSYNSYTKGMADSSAVKAPTTTYPISYYP
jgi:hypothetical protein